MTSGFGYWLIFLLVRTAFLFWHPVHKVIGRENVPADGKLVICSNHSGMADPFWIVLSMGKRRIPRIMAKKEAMHYPVVGWILSHIGVIGVDRKAADVHAIKEALRALRDEQQLLIFPEGTRVRDRKDSKPKAGAAMIAYKSGAPILPVYMSMRTRPFQPVTCVIGKPYTLDFGGKRPTESQLDEATQDLMNRIYEMGEKACR